MLKAQLASEMGTNASTIAQQQETILQLKKQLRAAQHSHGGELQRQEKQNQKTFRQLEGALTEAEAMNQHMVESLAAMQAAMQAERLQYLAELERLNVLLATKDEDEEAGIAALRDLRKVLHSNRAWASIAWAREAEEGGAAAQAGMGFGPSDEAVPADLALPEATGRQRQQEQPDALELTARRAEQRRRWQEALLVSALRDTDAATVCARSNPCSAS
eukprot:SAG11_NODE_7522_length_1135_cov_1.086873_2_plen_218_part_00